MRRGRRGLGGQIFGVFIFLIFAGIMLAVLKQFDWDFGAAMTWIANKLIDFVKGVSDYFSSLPTFRKLFGS